MKKLYIIKGFHKKDARYDCPEFINMVVRADPEELEDSYEHGYIKGDTCDITEDGVFERFHYAVKLKALQ